jgi:alpha-L-fucosidase
VKSIVDLVSRGGIFLLSLTPKGDGSIPEEEQQIMRGIGRWLKINGEAIYGTRPWARAGEGPAEMMVVNELNQRQEWNYRQPFTAQDIRFTAKGDTLYAIALSWPEDGKIAVTSLATGSGLFTGEISSVVLLGSDESLTWQRTANGLEITLPDTPPCEFAFSFQIN